MPFIRLSDNYIDHPKFLALSASAFRLWHEGMAFCRKHQTDGMIPFAALNGFRYFKPVRASELSTPYQKDAKPLWELIPEFGYSVHDYLFWNLSKEEEQSDKDAASARMRRLRKDRREGGSSPEQVGERSPTRAPFVPDRIGSDPKLLKDKSGEKRIFMRDLDDDAAERAGRFLEKYPELFANRRAGARCLIRPALDFQKACDLCKCWDSDRLEKMAIVFLESNEDWIERSGRTFAAFASRATWCDDRLKQWELQNGVVAV